MIDERAMIDLTDWTIHGGKLSDAAIAFPDAPSPWLDLSTGINPDPWPGAAWLAIDWQRLPDAAAITALEMAAACHFGARGRDVLALPGTELGLRGLRGLPLPAPFRHVAPGYGTHGEALPGSRAITADRLAEEAALGGTILCANPANPDGRLIAVDALLAIAATLAQSGGWLVVDEAFIDAHGDASILPQLSGEQPVIVMRSFGKFFGLAGVRLGFAVAPPAIIAPWRAAIGSWPVSAAAIAIGAAAYADADWIAATRQRLRARADAMDAVLRRHGLEPQGESPLFRLVDCDAARLFARLARRGILTRPFAYAPRWLRLGVPGCAADLDRLDRALGDE
ncbi:aminotransferase class I/II-fold pyridoxal phosphate-dependent enzyme [Sphingobium psychrophilum]|uniref:aminotransferase class I/II-fold pyridoxal phosphate-dependent enzyme n=1 Tax=Sphingobium psychrophilum TaxID=2728834 RepID=UPI001F3A855F|nr:aminotransferase class I/II-fold pyridoxal phosphate-dependent enzyme [Sphingobium psychrophilum]